MPLTRRRLYIILASALSAGYAWLLYEINFGRPDSAGLCIFRNLTNIPCPSCGSTRSVISLFHGNISDAVATNPLGIVIAAIMICLPPWLLFDLAAGKSTLYKAYFRMEQWLRKPPVAIPLVCLVIANWIWNIVKGL